MKLIQLPTGDYVNPDYVEAVAINAADPGRRTMVVLTSGSSVFVDCSRDEVVAALEKEER